MVLARKGLYTNCHEFSLRSKQEAFILFKDNFYFFASFVPDSQLGAEVDPLRFQRKKPISVEIAFVRWRSVELGVGAMGDSGKLTPVESEGMGRLSPPNSTTRAGSLRDA